MLTASSTGVHRHVTTPVFTRSYLIFTPKQLLHTLLRTCSQHHRLLFCSFVPQGPPEHTKPSPGVCPSASSPGNQECWQSQGKAGGSCSLFPSNTASPSSWAVHENNLSNTELELWIRIMLFVQKIENEIVPRTAAITRHIILEGFGVI